MRLKKIVTCMMLALFLLPLASQTVLASQVTQESKNLGDITVENPAPAWFTTIVDLSNDTTNDLYNNMNYTKMSDGPRGPAIDLHGDVGKYIFPLTPPIHLETQNQTLCYATTFSLTNKIVGAAFDTWFRIPFSVNISSTPLYDTEFNLRIYRFDTSTGNIANITNQGPIFNTNQVVEVWNATYFKNNTVNLFYYTSTQNISTVTNDTLPFVWLRATTIIDTEHRYAIFVSMKAPSGAITHIYPTEGDAFSDKYAGSWLIIDENTIYVPFDLDTTIFISNTATQGVVSERVEASGIFTTHIPIYSTLDGTLNIVVPVSTDGYNNITMNYTIYADATTEILSAQDYLIHGEDKIVYSLHLGSYYFKTITINLWSRDNKPFTVFLTEHQMGYDYGVGASLQNASLITPSIEDTILTTPLLLYGYVSIDEFTISNTRLNIMVVPFNHTTLPEDLAHIGLMYVQIGFVDEHNRRVALYEKYLEMALKIYMASTLVGINLKLLDMALEYGPKLYSWLTETIDNIAREVVPGWEQLKEFLGWLWDGLKSAVGFIVKWAEIAVSYTVYILYNLTRAIGVLAGVLLAMLAVNAADALGRGISKRDPLGELAGEWEKTYRVLMFVWVLFTGVISFLLGLINAVIPF